MRRFDLLILAVYFICVAYVLRRAIESLDTKYTMQVDQALLEQELERKNLKDVIAIKFNLNHRYKLEELRDLSINIENKTEEQSVYVVWDYSSLTDLGGRSRRVIRVPPDMTVELFQSQAPSVVAPGRTLKEKLTAEDLLKRKLESESLEISGLLIDIPKLSKGSPKEKEKYARFMAIKETLEFSLRLAIRVSEPTTGAPGQYVYIPCKFILKKVPWTDAFPWNQKKK